MKLLAAALIALTFCQDKTPDTVQTPQDYILTDLKTGYSRLETKAWAVEIPTHWDVMPANDVGERKIVPKDRTGEMSIKILPATTDSWEIIYNAHLFEMKKLHGGKSSGSRTRMALGDMDSLAYELIDNYGFAKRKYLILRNRKDNRLMVLSMTVPTRDDLRSWSEYFTQFTKTARFAGDS